MCELLSIEKLAEMASVLGGESWRHCSDIAQVAACYLAAHPKVGEVRYPGLKSDPLFDEAANKLRGGFGPYVYYRVGARGFTCLDCAQATDSKQLILELESTLAQSK